MTPSSYSDFDSHLSKLPYLLCFLSLGSDEKLSKIIYKVKKKNKSKKITCFPPSWYNNSSNFFGHYTLIAHYK